jgi:hypothetical protein
VPEQVAVVAAQSAAELQPTQRPPTQLPFGQSASTVQAFWHEPGVPPMQDSEVPHLYAHGFGTHSLLLQARVPQAVVAVHPHLPFAQKALLPQSAFTVHALPSQAPAVAPLQTSAEPQPVVAAGGTATQDLAVHAPGGIAQLPPPQSPAVAPQTHAPVTHLPLPHCEFVVQVLGTQLPCAVPEQVCAPPQVKLVVQAFAAQSPTAAHVLPVALHAAFAEHTQMPPTQVELPPHVALVAQVFALQMPATVSQVSEVPQLAAEVHAFSVQDLFARVVQVLPVTH